MVKFVASDLDGTLLLNGAQSVDESAIQYINKLVDKGVIFAPASGRQITSLKRLFGAVSDKLAYIAEYEGRSANKEIEQYIKKRVAKFESMYGTIDTNESL